jgi:hypothetical protein
MKPGMVAANSGTTSQISRVNQLKRFPAMIIAARAMSPGRGAYAASC